MSMTDEGTAKADTFTVTITNLGLGRVIETWDDVVSFTIDGTMLTCAFDDGSVSIINIAPGWNVSIEQ